MAERSARGRKEIRAHYRDKRDVRGVSECVNCPVRARRGELTQV